MTEELIASYDAQVHQKKAGAHVSDRPHVLHVSGWPTSNGMSGGTGLSRV